MFTHFCFWHSRPPDSSYQTLHCWFPRLFRLRPGLYISGWPSPSFPREYPRLDPFRSNLKTVPCPKQKTCHFFLFALLSSLPQVPVWIIICFSWLCLSNVRSLSVLRSYVHVEVGMGCHSLSQYSPVPNKSANVKRHEREKCAQIRSWKYFFCVNIDGWHSPFIIIYVILYLYYRFLRSITCLCCCKRECFGVPLHVLKLMSLTLVKLNCPARDD